VVDAELVQQRDGWGWLLGDAGSGFWLGRAAVRTTLDALQRGAPLGPMQREVLTFSGAPGYLELLQICYDSAPTWLAQYSPLVSRHAATDPVAAGLAERAVDRLEQLVFSLDLQPGDPIVLAGSVLSTAGPVSSGLRARLAGRVDNPVLTSTAGVIGALWLGLGSRVGSAPSVHRTLVASAGRWLTESR